MTPARFAMELTRRVEQLMRLSRGPLYTLNDDERFVVEHAETLYGEIVDAIDAKRSQLEREAISLEQEP